MRNRIELPFIKKRFCLFMKFIVFFFLFLYVNLLFTYKAFSQTPYEECNWRNQKFTTDLVEGARDFTLNADAPCLTCSVENKAEEDSNDSSFIETTKEVLSSNIPPECFFASMVHSVAKPPGKIKKGKRKGQPNYYYCQSAKDNNNTTGLSVTDNKGKKRLIYPRPPCLNEDYTMMTHKAFHEMADCFDFDSKDKEYLFKLFNHESHFILNNKSDTGARCYGQVTRGTLEEVNRRIYLSGNVNTNWKSEIYNDAVKKCPEIPNKVLIPDAIKPDGTQQRGFTSFDRHKSTARKLDCQLSQNALTCFFYSMYNIKINVGALEKTLSGDTHSIDSIIPQNREDIENTLSGLKKDFLLPINLNEVLVVKGSFTEKDGTKVHRSWVMKDDREMYHVLFDRNHNEKRTYDIKDLEVNKVKLYDITTDDKWDLLYKAYNGGVSVVGDKMKTFIEHEKSYIANGQRCKNRENDPHCEKRKNMLEGEQYQAPPFDHETFRRSARLSGQTREFTNSVKRSMNYLKDEGDDKLPNPLTHNLLKLHGINEGDEGEETIKSLIQSTKDKCSF